MMKLDFRARMRQVLAQVSAEERRRASRQAAALLRDQVVWRNARRILFYYPLADELDLIDLMGEADKTVALPRFDSERGQYEACAVLDLAKDLVPGRFGIREPAWSCRKISLNQLDLVLVPGVAFDNQGRRLGRGKGYYDRLLADIGGTKCGVALDEQIQPEIPAEPHDVFMNCVLTPTRWLLCGQGPVLK